MTRRIVLATTVDVSLGLMAGFPKFLVDRGWDVHVVSSGGPRLEELGRIPGVSVHSLPMRREPSPVFDVVALIRWVRLLREIRPDVVSLGTPKASLLGLTAAWLTRVRVRQYLVRGLRLETSSGVLRRVLSATEKLCVRLSTDVVAVSASLKREIVRLNLAPENQVAVVGLGSSNGVDLKQFDRRRFPTADSDALALSLGVDPDFPVMGFVGRITSDKGIETFLEVAHRLQSNVGGLQLLLVGGYDDADSAGSIRDAQEAGLLVTVVDHVEDPARYISLFDVMCFPTRREGFSNAAAEVSAMGVPVVGTRVTGLVDPVLDGVTGFLSDLDDVDSLLLNVERVLRDSALASRLGAAGSEYIRRNFERSHVQDAYEARLASMVPVS